MNLFFRRFLVLLFFVITGFYAMAQSSIDGVVMDKISRKPISNVTISVKKKNIGSLSDQKGHFVIPASRWKQNDTLILSSIGYSTLRIPISEALAVKDFFLSEESKNLENVVVKSYSNQAAEGSISEVTGYFRSWTTKKGGGEIGRIIGVRSDDFKVERVRFKVNNQCDTCVVRLHIRDLRNGLPDMDLLRDSITIEINQKSFDDKFVEFDLRAKNIIIQKHQYVFVSLETIHCNSAGNNGCSLAYIGTENGNFLYRTKDYREWEESTAHSLYLRMFYNY